MFTFAFPLKICMMNFEILINSIAHLKVQDLAAHRQSLLNERNTLQQFFRDIADEESWIKEKKLLVTSDDYGRDLTGVQNLRKKHKRFESELASHEPAIQSVQVGLYLTIL